MTIYVDENHRCHAENGDGRIPYDLQFFDGVSSLEREVIQIAIKDSLSAPFVLDEEGEIHRDTCIKYVSELLKMYADNRAIIVADSTHYQEAYLRMKETYDYAESRYRDLERYFFVEKIYEDYYLHYILTIHQ